MLALCQDIHIFGNLSAFSKKILLHKAELLHLTPGETLY